MSQALLTIVSRLDKTNPSQTRLEILDFEHDFFDPNSKKTELEKPVNFGSNRSRIKTRPLYPNIISLFFIFL